MKNNSCYRKTCFGLIVYIMFKNAQIRSQVTHTETQTARIVLYISIRIFYTRITMYAYIHITHITTQLRSAHANGQPNDDMEEGWWWTTPQW